MKEIAIVRSCIKDHLVLEALLRIIVILEAIRNVTPDGTLAEEEWEMYGL